ncbi:MAG: hypothetical protein B7Z78_11685 [Rhodospirillales bacterium 20-60-12]|nr:MAG: hypothetical protein B7Z78_11685 [Rhodospirillales bacterium 20-60-12]HQT66001.1 AzlC family ABC transporter permease [Acetobacteraceae bacterium]HQU02008.1 AzlC family ABC transporter permease [Acetobacteraceae bacterium]
MDSATTASTIKFTRAGFWRGMSRAWPLAIALGPFGLVVGIIIQSKGLTMVDCVLMNMFIYAGASEIVALANWTHPAPILAAILAAFVVNMRLALMGPVLNPWLAKITPVQRFFSLFVLVDPSWALAVTDMRKGGTDAAFYAGLSVPLWAGWVISSLVGYLAASRLNLPPDHPLFFAALASFIALLVPLWRGRSDALPWLVAGGVALSVARILPGSSWYIVAGALAGSITGAIAEHRK